MMRIKHFFAYLMCYRSKFAVSKVNYFILNDKEVYLHEYIIQVHCRKISNLFVWALETGRKVSLGKLFWPVSQPEQINFIFNDNVLILWLTCNIKSPKHLPKCQKITETSIILFVFNGVISWSVTSALILLPFLSVPLHESGTRNALLGPWLNNTEVYLTPFIRTQNHLQGKER